MTILSPGPLAQYFFSSLVIPIRFIQCFAKCLGAPCCVSLNIPMCPACNRSHSPLLCPFPPDCLYHPGPPALPPITVPSGLWWQVLGAGRSRQQPCPGLAATCRECLHQGCSCCPCALPVPRSTQNPLFPAVWGRGLCLVLTTLVPESISLGGSFPKYLRCGQS